MVASHHKASEKGAKYGELYHLNDLCYNDIASSPR